MQFTTHTSDSGNSASEWAERAMMNENDDQLWESMSDSES